MKIDFPVVVVGAGLAGLMTAYELHELGVNSAVLESSARAGGRIKSVRFGDGLTAEAGMEEFWQGGPAYGVLQRFGLSFIEDRALSSVVLDGRLFQCGGSGDRDDYFAGIFSAAERQDFFAWDALTRRLLQRFTDSSAAPPVVPDALVQTSMCAFASAIVGSRRVREWIRLVVEAETAVEWDRISAVDGVAEFRPFHDTPSGYGERNARVVGGNERLVEALIARLPDGAVHLRSPVTRIRDLGSHVEVHHLGPGGQPTIVTGEQVVVTVPSWSLPAIELELPVLDGVRAKALADAIATSASGSYVKVILRLRAEAATLWSGRGPGLFTLLSDTPAGCIYLREGPTDGHQHHLMTLLMHGRHARALSGLPSEVIVRRAMAELENLMVADGGQVRPRPLLAGISTMVTDALAADHPRAVAYWPVDRKRSRFDGLSQLLRTPHGRVHFGGDTTDSSHSDGALLSATRIVDAVSSALGGTL